MADAKVRVSRHPSRKPLVVSRRSSSPSPLAVDALKRFRIIYGSVRQHFRAVEERCGVSGSQLWILQEIACSGGVGVSDLALKLAIHQSTCSQLVEKLVHRGLVVKERDPADRRRVGLNLTAAGRRLIAKAPGPAEGVFPDVLKSLTADQLVELNQALENVIEGLIAHDPKLSGVPLADL